MPNRDAANEADDYNYQESLRLAVKQSNKCAWLAII